jgi:hypothetical protein
VFGSKNHVGIDGEYESLRRYTVTQYNGSQFGAALASDIMASAVWADTAYRSAKNLALPRRDMCCRSQASRAELQPSALLAEDTTQP